MEEKYNIQSILTAVDDLNKKKRAPKTAQSAPIATQAKEVETKKPLPVTPQDIPPAVDKMILEAEQFLKQKEVKVVNEEVAQEKEVSSKVIDEIYNKLSKKVNKSSLKTIVDLHLRIEDLESQLQASEKIIVTPPKIDQEKLKKISNKDLFKKEIVQSLEIQDATIEQLNTRLQRYKETEEKLRMQLIDLEQDNTILKDKAKKIPNTLPLIYKQIQLQKESYLNLKDYALKLKKLGQNLSSEKKSLTQQVSKLQDDNTKLAELGNEANKLKEMNDKLQKENSSLNQKINELNERMSGFDLEISQIKDDLANKEIEFNNYKSEAERDLQFYKANHEKIIIENNNIKARLENAKAQIESYEANKQELSSVFSQISEVLNKNASNVSNISDSPSFTDESVPDFGSSIDDNLSLLSTDETKE